MDVKTSLLVLIIYQIHTTKAYLEGTFTLEDGIKYNLAAIKVERTYSEIECATLCQETTGCLSANVER